MWGCISSCLVRDFILHLNSTFTRDSKRYAKKGSGYGYLSVGALLREAGRGVPLLRTSERDIEEGCGNRASLYESFVRGTLERGLLQWGL